MLIKDCKGYELEKEKSNTSEDFFNRSELTYIKDGKEKTLSVLYVRFFDQKMSEFTPFSNDPVFEIGSKPVSFKDIVALVCFIQNPGLNNRKRIYINTLNEFASYFHHVDFDKLRNIFEALNKSVSYELKSPLEFIVQPQ